MKVFMTDLNTAAESNIVKANESISNLNTSLWFECKKLEKCRSNIADDDTSFHSSISKRLLKFQDDLTVERKIMDKLTLRTTQFPAKTIKLKHAMSESDELKSERAVMKSCVYDVNSLLSNLPSLF